MLLIRDKLKVTKIYFIYIYIYSMGDKYYIFLILNCSFY